ncbi:MAG: hypothetical protein HY738_11505 [Bacteroidia bacterium]|nr:hypothetical protein [Bacteroidia bacterium]
MKKEKISKDELIKIKGGLNSSSFFDFKNDNQARAAAWCLFGCQAGCKESCNVGCLSSCADPIPTK